MVFKNETLNKAIRDLIEASSIDTGIQPEPLVTAIRAEQNAPIPSAKPFASVRILLLPFKGWAEIVHSDNVVTDIDEQISQKMMVRASINYFKNSVDSYSDSAIISAMDQAALLSLYLQGTASSQALDLVGIGVNRISEPRNVSALDKDQWEERAQMDVDFNVVSSRTDLICEIKSVLVQGSYQEHNNALPVSVLIDDTEVCN